MPSKIMSLHCTRFLKAYYSVHRVNLFSDCLQFNRSSSHNLHKASWGIGKRWIERSMIYNLWALMGYHRPNKAHRQDKALSAHHLSRPQCHIISSPHSAMLTSALTVFSEYIASPSPPIWLVLIKLCELVEWRLSLEDSPWFFQYSNLSWSCRRWRPCAD